MGAPRAVGLSLLGEQPMGMNPAVKFCPDRDDFLEPDVAHVRNQLAPAESNLVRIRQAGHPVSDAGMKNIGLATNQEPTAGLQRCKS